MNEEVNSKIFLYNSFSLCNAIQIPLDVITAGPILAIPYLYLSVSDCFQSHYLGNRILLMQQVDMTLLILLNSFQFSVIVRHLISLKI